MRRSQPLALPAKEGLLVVATGEAAAKVVVVAAPAAALLVAVAVVPIDEAAPGTASQTIVGGVQLPLYPVSSLDLLQYQYAESFHVLVELFSKSHRINPNRTEVP